ncbi:TetR/AcrR family transcriptional regulator [Nocardioides panacisoli]|uniref:TetR/AcrR family transcriptional regulator n=1 Tax=Nocardioides panacisoli TaxID=627624 RepID=UPI001C632FEF|nr:TetR/AcrR family transcriptional regulator [Nocardioides panacisoli]QYJ05348.1 TetR/AcrR family transcriptional regulator [Nocardioides panacisoli]
MTAQRVVRGRRLPPDERREQIVDCAEALFANRAYADVSTTEIARRAGVARGLLNHYFGDKRSLYLEVVRRSALLTPLEDLVVAEGPLAERVDQSVAWFLDSIEPHRTTYLTVSGAVGLGEDPEVTAILDEAADLAARRVLEMVGVDAEDETARAVMRAYGGLVRESIREWSRGGRLTRDQAHHLLCEALLAIVERVLPRT